MVAIAFEFLFNTFSSKYQKRKYEAMMNPKKFDGIIRSLVKRHLSSDRCKFAAYDEDDLTSLCYEKIIKISSNLESLLDDPSREQFVRVSLRRELESVARKPRIKYISMWSEENESYTDAFVQYHTPEDELMWGETEEIVKRWLQEQPENIRKVCEARIDPEGCDKWSFLRGLGRSKISETRLCKVYNVTYVKWVAARRQLESLLDTI